MPLQYIWLLPLGVAVGAFGTLIGAGGGFLLVPILLVLYPADGPDVITSISLAVVFCNAGSGSWAYARLKRIDYRAGIVFSLVGVPGAIVGAYSTSFIPRRAFDLILGLLMLAAALYMMLRPLDSHPAHQAGAPQRPKHWLFTGSAISVIVGFVSSVLGIGGGIIHVPALVYLLNFPLHTATATSHFILAILAGSGTITHITHGAFHHGARRAAMLAIGVVAGAQIGAHLSTRFHAARIVRFLAVALALVGIRLLMLAFT